MVDARSILDLIASCLIYSFVIFLADFILFLIIWKDLTLIDSSLSLLILAEGGLLLIVGGAIGLNSPIIGKMGEIFLHSKPWNAERQKKIEKQTKAWILTGIILVFIALFLSFA